MHRPVMRGILLLLLVFIGTSTASNGCVELDRLNFDKIVRRFKYTLVKFDVAFPYGEKHEAFTNFATENTENIDDLLFAMVGIKDYGDKENADLGKRFKIPEKYPVIKLFNNETLDKYVDYPEDDPVTVDNLRKFISSNADLYIGLPGCLKEIDELAMKFANPSNTNVELLQIMSEVEAKKDLYPTEKATKSYQIYLALMKKMANTDKTVKQFIAGEKERVRNLLKGKISDNKKADLNLRLNVMESFKQTTRNANKSTTSDEL